MGVGHSHHNGAEDWSLPLATKRWLIIAIAACVAATLVGAVMLWPRGRTPAITGNLLGFDQLSNANVVSAELAPCSFSAQGQNFTCNDVEARITSGPSKGDLVPLQLPLNAGIPRVHQGDKIILSYAPDAPDGDQYQFADFQRKNPMLMLAVLFGVVVIALGRWRGLMALAGLVMSLVVLLVFVLPSLLHGHDPLAVAIVGASMVAILALYMAHGVNTRTTVALLGSFAALLLTALLAQLFVGAAKFTGLAQEEAGFLQLTAGQVNLKGLLLAGVVIGSLGVLDDVTVTQVSAVWEVHQADPTLGHRALYRAGVRVGRDHIASTVNTLVLAYAGAALPLLLLFSEAHRPLSAVVTTETVGVEVVRTLVGSIGLVASVPLTTALAAAVIPLGSRPAGAPAGPAAEAIPPESPPPQWDPAVEEDEEGVAWRDFAPDDDLRL